MSHRAPVTKPNAIVLEAIAGMVRAESATNAILSLGLSGTCADDDALHEAFQHLKFVSQLPEHIQMQIMSRSVTPIFVLYCKPSASIPGLNSSARLLSNLLSDHFQRTCLGPVQMPCETACISNYICNVSICLHIFSARTQTYVTSIHTETVQRPGMC